jgi:hypothetical protein
MNLIKLTLTTFLMTLLIACGGGSPGDPSNVGSTEGTTEEETEEVIDGITEEVTVGTPSLGNGSDAGFVAGELALELNQISAGGTSNITASVVDVTKNNQFITTRSYAVVFSSRCAGREPAQATFSAQDNTVITNSGDIVVSYTAAGCTGVDKITATLYEVEDGVASATVLASAEADVTVETADFGAISFEGNSAEALTFTGIANSVLKSFNVVTFKVIDSFGNPIEGAEVDFILSSGENSTANLAIDSGKTNAAGEVTTIVNAGTSHELLSVQAITQIVPDKTKPTETAPRTTSSLPVSVSTGIAVQSNFSLSADKFSVNSFNVDGVTVSVTARLGDRYGNPVPEGTVVQFTAESGSIPSFCIVGASGECSVDWSSQGLRPGQFPVNTAGTKNQEYLPVIDPVDNVIKSPVTYALQDAMGYTTITAYAMGEAGFFDANANGIFERDETTNIDERFESYPEVFRDDNYDSVYTLDEEEFFEFVQDGVYSPAPTVYQGPLCNEAASNAGHCASNMYITQSVRIIQSYMAEGYSVRFYKFDGTNFIRLVEPGTPLPLPANTSDAAFDVSGDGELYVLVTDENGNLPEAEVTLTFTAENYKAIEPKTVSKSAKQVITQVGFPENRGLLHSFRIYEDVGAAATQLEVKISGGEGKALLNITP